jgi:hypothetical protein
LSIAAAICIVGLAWLAVLHPRRAMVLLAVVTTPVVLLVAGLLVADFARWM